MPLGYFVVQSQIHRSLITYGVKSQEKQTNGLRHRGYTHLCLYYASQSN